MGKATKKVTVEVNAVAAQPSTAVDDWQAQDDARELLRVGALMRDKKRLSRAQEFISGATKFMERKSPRLKARGGRKTSARNIGKR